MTRGAAGSCLLYEAVFRKKLEDGFRDGHAGNSFGFS